MLAFSRHDPDAAIADLDDVLVATNRPVGATLLALLATPELRRAVARAGPRHRDVLGSTRCGASSETASIVGWQVGDVDEAKAAVDVGCQYVIAQGVEAGGHVRGTMPLHELVPPSATRSTCPWSPPAASELAPTSRGRSRSEPTRCESALDSSLLRESAAHPQYVEMLSEATAADTVMTETFSARMAQRPAPSARLVHRCGREARTGSSRSDDRRQWRRRQRCLERFNTCRPRRPPRDRSRRCRSMRARASTRCRGGCQRLRSCAELTDGLDSS